MTKKRKKILIKLIVLFILAAILAWIGFLGGCVDSSRLRLHNNIHMETGGSVSYILLGAFVSIILLLKYNFETQIKAIVEKRMRLLSVKLLI